MVGRDKGERKEEQGERRGDQGERRDEQGGECGISPVQVPEGCSTLTFPQLLGHGLATQVHTMEMDFS